MPTYDYQCDACQHRFEKFQSISAEPVKTCPSCGKKKVRRLIGTGAGLIFKGSGFYITDYRSEGYKAAAKGESGAASSNGSGSEGKARSDGKTPEAKPAQTKAAAPAKETAKPAGATKDAR